jgi:hypothetical protein
MAVEAVQALIKQLAAEMPETRVGARIQPGDLLRHRDSTSPARCATP